MRYLTAAAFRAALERRLLVAMQQTNVPLALLRKLVVFERLLARLIIVAPDRWVLKGAVALHFRLRTRYRTNKDLDLGWCDDERAAAEDFAEAERVDLNDHFQFAILRTDKLDQLLEGAAVRYHISSYLAGRPFDEITVDVGFGDPLPVVPERLRGPDLLSFAEIEAVDVPTISLDQHIAEKVHAITRVYTGGRASTRVKDLVDLVLISSQFAFDADRLRTALGLTFERRGTHGLPSMLPAPPPQWSTPFAKMAAELGLDTMLSAGYEMARSFLDPVLGGFISDYAQWDPDRRSW